MCKPCTRVTNFSCERDLPRVVNFSRCIFIFVQVACVFVAGCGDEDYLNLDGCNQPDSGDLILGTGNEGFESADGASFVFTAGFQGGYHLYGSLRLPVELAGPARVAINLCQQDTVIARARLNEEFLEADGYSELAGVLVILLQGYRPENRANIPSVLTATVEDQNGTKHTASLDLTPTCCVGLGQEANPSASEAPSSETGEP